MKISLVVVLTTCLACRLLAQGDHTPTENELSAIPRYQPSSMGTGVTPQVDLRQSLIGGRWMQSMPFPRNQGQTQSCTAWAVAYAVKSYHEAIDQQWSPNQTSRQFSPSFVYNKVNGGEDRGSFVGDVMEVIVNEGCATMATMPFTGNPQARPSNTAVNEAQQFKAQSYSKVSTGLEMQMALARGDPIVVSVRTNPLFNSGRFQIYTINEKRTGDQSLQELQRSNPGTPYKHGYHAMCAVGYDDQRQAFLLMNSWGSNWGGGDGAGGGHCWVHYDLFRTMNYRDETLFCRGAFILHDIKQQIHQTSPVAALPIDAHGRIAYNGLQEGRHTWSWTVQLAGAIAQVSKVVWTVPTGNGRNGNWTSNSSNDGFALTGTNIDAGKFTVKGTVYLHSGLTQQVEKQFTFVAPKKKSIKLVQNDKYWGISPQTKRPTWQWTISLEGSLTEMYQIKSVTYHLHPTFNPPDRRVTSSPLNGFAYTTNGWGTFPVRATVRYQDGSTQSLSLNLNFKSPQKDQLTINNTARYVGPGNDGKARYNWTVFVEGPLGKMQRIRNVRYFLHPTFPVNVIDVNQKRDFGFPYSATGWGTFEVKALVSFDDGSQQQLRHQLSFR